MQWTSTFKILCTLNTELLIMEFMCPHHYISGSQWSRRMHRPPWEHTCPDPHLGQASHGRGGRDQGGARVQRPAAGVYISTPCPPGMLSGTCCLQTWPCAIEDNFQWPKSLEMQHFNFVDSVLLLPQCECAHWMPPPKEYSEILRNDGINLWSVVMRLCSSIYIMIL
jgi:hypothetical protein